MIKWIMWFVSTASISLLVDGVPCEPFKIQRVSRQGDPISPSLFNIVFESLNYVISEAFSKGSISGLCIGFNGIELTHLNMQMYYIVLPK